MTVELKITDLVRRIDLKAIEISDFIIDDYERAHRGQDTWGALERRARFNRQDRGLMNQWLALARQRERATQAKIAQRISRFMDEKIIAALYGVRPL